jgi:hypothetical protein
MIHMDTLKIGEHAETNKQMLLLLMMMIMMVMMVMAMMMTMADLKSAVSVPLLIPLPFLC